MATIDSTGIKGTSLTEYLELLGQQFQTAFGDDIDLSDQAPAGQLNGIYANTASDLDDALVAEYGYLNPYNMVGAQLDGWGAYFNIFRRPATPSTVTAQVTGVPTTLIPAGSRARTTEGDIFLSSEDILLDVSGNGSGAFQSAETGATPILANTLTQIVDTDVIGWETVNNADAGTLGQVQQSDTLFRQFIYNTIAVNAVSTVEAIRSKVLTLSDVLGCNVYENDTAANITIQNVTLLPHSIAVIVNGGTAQEIGEAIQFSKTVGANTEGANTAIQTMVTVATNDGQSSIDIYYYPVVFVTLQINVTIQLYQASPDVINTIKMRIIEYFAGTFNGGTNEDGSIQFDVSGIGIAEASYLSRLYTPINSVSGFEVLDLTQEVLGSGNPQSVITPDLNQQLVVDEDNINVTIL